MKRLFLSISLYFLYLISGNSQITVTDFVYFKGSKLGIVDGSDFFYFMDTIRNLDVSNVSMYNNGLFQVASASSSFINELESELTPEYRGSLIMNKTDGKLYYFDGLHFLSTSSSEDVYPTYPLSVPIYNATNDTLYVGDVVGYTGSMTTLGYIDVTLFEPEMTHYQFVGLVSSKTEPGGTGSAIGKGIISNVNTSSFTDSTLIFSSSSNPGYFTADSSSRFSLGTVIDVGINGSIYVNPVLKSRNPDWGDITNIPADILDGDDNTQLTEAQVDSLVANNGYLTSYTETDPIYAADSSVLVDTSELMSEVNNIYSYIGLILTDSNFVMKYDPTVKQFKNVSSDTINVGDVVAYAGADGNSGNFQGTLFDPSFPSYYLMGIASIETPPDSIGEVISEGPLKKVNTTSYLEGTILYTSPTSPGHLSDTSTSNIIVASVLKSSPNGSIFIRPDFYANEHDPIYVSDSSSLARDSELVAGVQEAKDYTDTGVQAAKDYADANDSDTQLSESEVDAFVSNNGYLTSEVDGSTTNEIQDLELISNTLSLTGDPTAVDLSIYLDNTDDQTASEVSFTATGEIASTNTQTALVELDTDLRNKVSIFQESLGSVSVTIDAGNMNQFANIDLNTASSVTLSLVGTPTSGGVYTFYFRSPGAPTTVYFPTNFSYEDGSAMSSESLTTSKWFTCIYDNSDFDGVNGNDDMFYCK